MARIRREFLRFVVVGCVNTLHYYLVYLLFLHVMGVHYFPAHLIGVVSSVIGSYFLNTLYTYKVRPSWETFLRFPLTQLFNMGVTVVLLYLLVEQLHINSSLAPILAVLVTLPATFILTGRMLKTSCKKEIVSY